MPTSPKPKTVKTSRETRRKGKKSVPWQNDPEILQRLEIVADMLSRCKNSVEIANELHQPIDSTKRDIKRVRQLWKKLATEKIDDARGRSVAMYQYIQRKAFEKVESQPADAHVYLDIVGKMQDKIDKIYGAAAPTQIQVEHKFDIEKVRQKRWQEIAPALEEVLGETDDTTE